MPSLPGAGLGGSPPSPQLGLCTLHRSGGQGPGAREGLWTQPGPGPSRAHPSPAPVCADHGRTAMGPRNGETSEPPSGAPASRR